MAELYREYFRSQLEAIFKPVASIAKSRGHMFFTTEQEFFLRDGDVFRAPLHNSFNTDGYRHSRWECTKAHWDRYENAEKWGKIAS